MEYTAVLQALMKILHFEEIELNRVPGGKVHDGAEGGTEDGVLAKVEHGEAVARLE